MKKIPKSVPPILEIVEERSFEVAMKRIERMRSTKTKNGEISFMPTKEMMIERINPSPIPTVRSIHLE
jgi:hypothetical protein